jgi:carboxylesterase type B
MHHLTAFGGKQDPLFKKAILQSPAFNPVYDRRGDAEKAFHDFARVVGCNGDKAIQCLRERDFKDLNDAQLMFINSLPFGSFGFGPVVDGTWVRQLPALELATGNFAKGVESLIITHVSDEATMFVMGKHNETTFNQFVDRTFGKKPWLLDAINKKYPFPTNGSKYATHRSRLEAVVQFSTFTCNARFLAQAYNDKAYSAQYSAGRGTHGSDIAANFYGSSNLAQLLPQWLMSGGADLRTIAPKYQSYLISHARTGNPNTLKAKDAIEWPMVRVGSVLSNVLNVNSPFTLVADMMNQGEDCDFWLDLFSGITNSGGKSFVAQQLGVRLTWA